jgi:lipid-A-disaccharide synthase
VSKLKIYLIAGEASGDLHASNLLRELRLESDRAIECRAWGGDLLQKEGATLVKHYKELAFMGFKEVILNLKTIMNNIKFCKQDILAFQPDVIIFIDYPGFNLRIAEWSKKQGFTNLYFIAPQVWAWKENRVSKIKRDINKLYCILPFEVDFFKKHQYEVEYKGHPLVELIDKFNPELDFYESINPEHKKIIAILPGSRKQEIIKKLPEMLKAIKELDNDMYLPVVAVAPGLDISLFDEIANELDIKIKHVVNNTYAVLKYAHLALVTSGTATLETALFNVPLVVCYKGSKLSYEIGKRLVKVKYISLVNLILDKELVKELIQDDMNAKNIKTELDKLTDEHYRQEIMLGFETLRAKLHQTNTIKNIAKSMLDYIH